MVLGGVAGYGSAAPVGMWPSPVQQAPAQAAGAQLPAVQANGAPGEAAGGQLPGEIAQQRAYANVMNDKFAQECQTCKNRKYQDGSDDPGVSFQTPQGIDPSVAASVVAGHEQEHVMRERANAKAEGGEVIMQTVVLHGDICPECGKHYISGGTTRTVTRSGGGQQNPYDAMMKKREEAEKGSKLDVGA